MSNHLTGSTSPYLLQHANNPVDWYPWGAEALEKARSENKPIFLSIGYAACHWCHVMAHESFEDLETAAILNACYVSIKVDREERPDLDSIYMSAVIALTGQAGWPMSVFLTPDLQPFYGGTYFPPEPRHGLPSFKNLLLVLFEAWKSQREEVLRVGGQITAQLVEQTNQVKSQAGFDAASLSTAAINLQKTYDWQEGGWGPAPKFPQPMAIEFLLRRHLAGDTGALEPALHALRAMAQGGMYDVIGGGFARYSTDALWRIPHFEKMLYDNAQLARVYLHAWLISGDASFRRVVEETLAYVGREMLAPEGGFYSSLDADSAGQEGQFYVWTLEETNTILSDQSAFFELAYGITSAGNWEGKTVLQRAVDDSSLASHFNLSTEQVAAKLADCHARLLTARNARIRPTTDDKVLTSWNGLMLVAFAEAARVLDDPEYLNIATRNADFLLTALRPDGGLRRAWRAGRTGQEVFLEDYASLILGLLALYQTDFDNRWFSQAYSLTEEMLRRFSDPSGGFFDTPAGPETILARHKDLQDNATPSGNSLAAEALLQISTFTGEDDWRVRAEQALALVSGLAPRYPSAFGRWLSAVDFALSTVKQVAIIGELDDPRTKELAALARKSYRPNMVITASSLPLPDGCPSLLNDRPILNGKPTAYVCQGFVCQLPVTAPGDLVKQL